MAARHASEEGAPLDLDAELLERLAEEPPPRIPLLEGMDKVLLYLADRAESHFARITFHAEHDFTLLGFTDERQMSDCVRAAADLGYLDAGRTSLTVEGWRRIEEVRRQQPEGRKAFVAMWFDDSMETAWREGFLPGIRDTEYFEPKRVLDDEHAGKIDDHIIAEIRTSALLVADFTGQRGGVYFEAGFAMGLGIPVIWSCRDDQINDVHFDTRQYNHIEWSEPADLREKLTNRILAVVPRATQG